MALPAIVKNGLVPLTEPASKGLFRAIIAVLKPTPKPQFAPISVEVQDGNNWCWASVAVAIGASYGHPIQQCDLVSSMLSVACCGPAKSDPNVCDKQGSLRKALCFNKTLAEFITDQTKFDFDMVKHEIDQKRPLGARFKLTDTFHVIAIDGYVDDAARHIHVQDPVAGPSCYPESALKTNYLAAGGEWVTAYKTIDPAHHDPIVCP